MAEHHFPSAYVSNETKKKRQNNNTVTVYASEETKTRLWSQMIIGMPDTSSAELLVYL